ncbi:hypothetical protein OO010_12505 [Flavobacteriaceae bacterium KMM 6898]|nr:hypothetical protein [Flavobacteriaceae bacterium KMM 6898]
MLKISTLRNIELTEYLLYDINSAAYKFYHEILIKIYEVEPIDFRMFLDESYKNAAVFYFNYKDLPYEVDEYLFNESNKVNESNVLLKGFQIVFIHNIILEITQLYNFGDWFPDDLANNHFVRQRDWNFLEDYPRIVQLIESVISRKFGEKTEFHDFINEYEERKESDGMNAKESYRLENFFHSLFDNSSIKKSNASKQLLINGKKPNMVDRYRIANEVLDIYNVIRKKNISQTEKHELLAHILGCNEQTARGLWNGTLLKRTKLNEDIILPYLDKLK